MPPIQLASRLATLLTCVPLALCQGCASTDLVKYDGVDFAPAPEGTPVEIAVLWGDPQAGPAALMIKYPPGYHEKLHTHPSDYRAVVIEGKIKQYLEGELPESAQLVGPGSVLVQEAGNYHELRNLSDEPATLFVHFEGPVGIHFKWQ